RRARRTRLRGVGRAQRAAHRSARRRDAGDRPDRRGAGPPPRPVDPDSKRAMGLRPVTRGALLRLDNVRVALGGVAVLDGIDLDVRDGEFVALVGPSGCGKTTLLNVCSGWLTPTSGRVDRPAAQRMVFQQDGLFPWLTVEENIALGIRQAAAEP